LGDLILDLHIEDRDEGATPDYVDKFFSVNSLFTNWQARQQFISSRYSKKLGDKWFFYNTAYYRISDFGVKSRLTTFNGYAQDRRELIDFFNPSRINPEWTRVSYFQQCKQFRDEFRAQYTINDHFDLLVGLEIRNGIFQSNYLTTSISDNAMFNGTVQSNPGGNNPAMFEGGGFGSLTYSNTARKININVGGRYDYTWVNEDTKVSYGKFNPRLSAVFYPGNWVFKLIYSEAMFAFPSFVRFSSSVSRIPPDNLAPETVKNIEFNVTHVLKGGKFTTEWVGYKSTYADMLITNKVKGLDQYGNWPNTTNEVMGAQMNTQWKVNRFIDFNTNATVNHSVFLTPSSTNPDEITTLKTAQISDFTLYAGFGTKFLKDKIYFYISSNVVGNKYTGKGTSLANSTQLITIPGYQLINAALKVDIFQNITFQVIGRNLLNHYYAAPGIRSASGSQSSLVPQPGRNIHLALNFRF
jgi:outer membrane receptor protein involved in Fe transport